MADPIEYTRLPGAGNTSTDGRFLYRHRAYLGADHILMVRRSRYGETYRRLYLDDIQSAFYCETDDARVFSAGTLAGAISGAGLAAVFAQSPINGALVGTVISIMGVTVLTVAFVLNVVQGMSVRCWIRTTGGETLVPSVGRLRAARRFITTINDAVSMRQGVADRDAVEQHLAGLHTPLSGESASMASPPPSYRWIWLLFLFEAVYVALTMAAPNDVPPGLWILITIVTWGVTLMLVFRSGNQRLYFPYRALISAASFYVTARALYWALYWFLLTMDQIIVFEIARQDLMLLGGATIVANVIFATLGFVISPTYPKRATAAVDPESVPPKSDES